MDSSIAGTPTTKSIPNFVVEFKKPFRKIDKVFLHCSASDNSKHDDISVIRDWHSKRGFKEVGYHYFIKKNGTIQPGRSLEVIPAAQKGHNTHSIAICVSGLEHFTDDSLAACKVLCREIDKQCGKGKIKFFGHREVAPKECPVFDYHSIIGIDPKTHKLIYH